MCGGEKCYFPSFSHCLISDEGASKGRCIANVGYLISAESSYQNLPNHTVWLYASCLAARYGVKHFLLGPEERVVIPKQAAVFLQGTRFHRYTHKGGAVDASDVVENAPHRTSVLLGEKLTQDFAKHSLHHVMVYRLQEAPSGVIFRCTQVHQQERKTWGPFLASVEMDKALFVSTLSRQLSATYRMLSNEFCLIRDFQVVINREGYIHHLDLDRCFTTNSRTGAAELVSVLRETLATTAACFEDFRLHVMVQFNLTEASGGISFADNQTRYSSDGWY